MAHAHQPLLPRAQWSHTVRYCSVLVPLHVDALVASSASLEVGNGADLQQCLSILTLNDGGFRGAA